MAVESSTAFVGLAIGLVAAVAFAIGYYIAALRKEKEKQIAVQDAREDTKLRQRATVGGQVAEVLRPYIGEFPFDPSDLTFIGDPIDFIAFNGKASGRIDEIVFIEVKRGTSGLRTSQRQVRDAIQANSVRWVETRFPEPPPG